MFLGQVAVTAYRELLRKVGTGMTLNVSNATANRIVFSAMVGKKAKWMNERAQRLTNERHQK